MSRSARAVEIEISFSALQHNFQIARSLSPASRIFAVLKSDAYGHGAVECAKALKDADAFAVAVIDEAIILREAGVKKKLLVLQGPRCTEDVNLIQRHSLTPVIHDWSQLGLIQNADTRSEIPLWIKIDTGMGRLGFLPDAADRVLSILLRIAGTRVEGLLAHFACADEPATGISQQQLRTLLDYRRHLQGLYNREDPQNPVLQLSHANSAALLAYPESHLDWVRPGILLYGSDPLASGAALAKSSQASLSTTQPAATLRPVMKVRAPLLALKIMPKGTPVGYGHTYACPEKMPVGFVAIGYGDGLPRALGNAMTDVHSTNGVNPGANVAVHGRSAPILGRVSMDSIAIDLRGHNIDESTIRQLSGGQITGSELSCQLPYKNAGEQVRVGEMVEIWGDSQPVEALAANADTLPYELFCSIRGTRQWV